jgi:carbon storage regulator
LWALPLEETNRVKAAPPTFRQELQLLVLSRKKGESIIINDDITVVVVEIRGDKVRLGVEAPKEVAVHRKEVYDNIRKQGQNIHQDHTPNPKRHQKGDGIELQQPYKQQ